MFRSLLLTFLLLFHVSHLLSFLDPRPLPAHNRGGQHSKEIIEWLTKTVPSPVRSVAPSSPSAPTTSSSTQSAGTRIPSVAHPVARPGEAVAVAMEEEAAATAAARARRRTRGGPAAAPRGRAPSRPP